jgi:hypothetical protein
MDNNFIDLFTNENDETYLNAALICFIKKDRNRTNCTLIYFAGNTSLSVKGSTAEIKKKIQDAGR